MMNEMMENCCPGMGPFMWIGMLLLLILLVLLILWLVKQIRK